MGKHLNKRDEISSKSGRHIGQERDGSSRSLHQGSEGFVQKEEEPDNTQENDKVLELDVWIFCWVMVD